MNSISTVKNEQLGSSLLQDGFVVTKFFNEEELSLIRAFYAKNHSSVLPGLFNHIHMTTWSSDKQHKTEVNLGLRQLFKAPCDRLFNNYRAVNHVFIVKQSNPNSEFFIHQDWSVVDENQFHSFNVWVTLNDIGEKDGALWIIPGSHRINQKIRGCGILYPDYSYLNEKLISKKVSIPLKAGEGILFFHSTLHGSPPNLSDKPRIVAVNSILPKDAPLRIHYQKTNTSPLEIYEPDDEFVYEYDNIREESILTPPKGKLVEIKPPIAINVIEI
jgi:hypothetical protein